MTKREQEQRHRMYQSLNRMGLSWDECETLHKISMTLSRWSESECNGDIERQADRERGALKRLEAIMANHKSLIAYNQGDPRGAAIYILRKDQLAKSEDISSVYNRGIAVY